MVRVTFSDSDFAPVPKFLNPGPAILQIWESDSCSDSGYNHRSNRSLPMFLPKKWLHRLLLLPKWKSESGSGSGFSQIFDSGSGSGSERKTQNPAGVDSVNPDRSHLCCVSEVASDAECQSRLQQDSTFFVSQPEPESKIFEKPDPDTESFFIFGSSRSLRGLYQCQCHCLITNLAEFRLSGWFPQFEQKSDSQQNRR